MGRTIRIALLAGAVVSALAFTGSALASFAPKLAVDKSATGAVSITASVNTADDPTAQVQIYVPTGYQVNTSVAPGTKLGDVTATAQATGAGGVVLPLTGELDAIPPNATAQAQCGVQTAAATWDIHVAAAGQALDIPLFVTPTAGPETTIGALKLVVCLTPPAQSLLGAKLLSASFASSAITAPASGGPFRWTSLWTPYASNQGPVNKAGTVEAQAVVAQPAVKLAVKRTKVVRTTTVRVHGRKVQRRHVTTSVAYTATVTQGGTPVAGATVTAKLGAKTLGTAKTTAAGTATGRFVLASGSATLSVSAEVPSRDLGASGCTASAAFGGLPCVGATASGGVQPASARVSAYRR
jgi:hypothetical protein